jgi:hypothetical protein
MVKLTLKMILVRILLIGIVVAVFTAVAIYYKNTVFAP